MDAIKTSASTLARMIALVLHGLAKGVPTMKSASLGSTATTAFNTPNPFARANDLPRFAR